MYFIISKTLKKIIFYNIYHEVTTHMRQEAIHWVDRQTTVSVENYYYCYACQKIDLMAFHVKNNVISYWIWYFFALLPCMLEWFIYNTFLYASATNFHTCTTSNHMPHFFSPVMSGKRTYIHIHRWYVLDTSVKQRCISALLQKMWSSPLCTSVIVIDMNV